MDVYSVLIVEDEPMIIKMYSVMLEREKNVSFHIISSVEQFAEDYRNGLPAFDIAIVDACLKSREVNVIPLLKQLKIHNPKAVIVAASANHNHELVAAGANQACQKFQVANLVIELIKHLN